MELLKKRIKELSEKFLKESENKEIFIVSHFDTDGITSASILAKTLKEIDKPFSLKIVKSLEEGFFKELPKEKLIIFLDLASNSLDYLAQTGIENIFIIDHHEISKEIPFNINIVNPELIDNQKISSAGLVYLFCRNLNPKSKETAKLAVIGMIGDMLEKEIDKMNNEILVEGEIKKRRGLLLFPSTRPINRVLEYSSEPYSPIHYYSTINTT